MTGAVKELSQTQTVELSRTRRTLQQGVEDATENLAWAQANLDLSADAARDATNRSAMKQLLIEQDKVRELGKLLSTAKAALAAFEKTSPSAEQVAENESRLATEATRLAREKARAPFIRNRTEAIECLQQLIQLDKEATELFLGVPGTSWSNPMEADSLSKLLTNWPKYNFASDGLTSINRALSMI